MIPHSRPWITNGDAEAVREALASGFIAQGIRTEQFERMLSEWAASIGGVAVASGAAAIHLALEACLSGSNDEVILPTYVCRHLLQAVLAAGAKPVLCDVGDCWLVEPENVAPLINARTRALLLPHLYGMYVDIESFRKFGVPIIEDCAQALGPRETSKVAGDLAVYSFHPTKCLTTGEGGMVVARGEEPLECLRKLRDGDERGCARRSFSPMSDLAAALGASQLSRYGEFLARRQRQAAAYAAALAGSAADFQWYGRRRSMFFRFPVHFAGGFEKAESSMAAHGVIVRRGVDELLHRHLGLPDSAFPKATMHFSRTVSLPIYPSMAADELDCCLAACRACLFECV